MKDILCMTSKPQKENVYGRVWQSMIDRLKNYKKKKRRRAITKNIERCVWSCVQKWRLCTYV